ncbi:unnamed protein product, partial [Candidula unifasciata]
CAAGTFGHGCSSSCSKNCESSANKSMCNPETGVCVQGCKSGFAGQYCEN